MSSSKDFVDDSLKKNKKRTNDEDAKFSVEKQVGKKSKSDKPSIIDLYKMDAQALKEFDWEPLKCELVTSNTAKQTFGVTIKILYNGKPLKLGLIIPPNTWLPVKSPFGVSKLVLAEEEIKDKKKKDEVFSIGFNLFDEVTFENNEIHTQILNFLTELRTRVMHALVALNQKDSSKPIASFFNLNHLELTLPHFFAHHKENKVENVDDARKRLYLKIITYPDNLNKARESLAKETDPEKREKIIISAVGTKCSEINMFAESKIAKEDKIVVKKEYLPYPIIKWENNEFLTNMAFPLNPIRMTWTVSLFVNITNKIIWIRSQLNEMLFNQLEETQNFLTDEFEYEVEDDFKNDKTDSIF